MSLLKVICIMLKPLYFLYDYVNSKEVREDKFTIPSFILPIIPPVFIGILWVENRCDKKSISAKKLMRF